MSNGEQKVDAVIDELAAIAGVVGQIPEPFAPAVLVFAGAAPILGHEAVRGIGWLIHKLHHSKNPQAAAAIVLKVAHAEADNYTDPNQVYGG